MRRASLPLFCLSPVGRAVFCLASAATLGIAFGAAQAQVTTDAAVLGQPAQTAPAARPLKMTPMMAEDPPPGDANKPPTFVFGDKVSGRTDLETIVDGNAELRQGPTAIKADRLEYYQPDDLATIARGHAH